MRYLSSVLVLSITVGFTQAAEVKTLADKSYKGDLLSITDKEIKVRVDGKEETIPAADVLTIEFEGRPAPENVPHQLVKLTDGTLLKCQAFALKGKTTEVRLLNGTALKFPSTYLHYALHDAVLKDEKSRAEFEKSIKGASQDTLFLTSKIDETKIIPFKGFVGDADEKGENIDFKIEGSAATPQEMSRFRGVIYSRKSEAKPSLFKVKDQWQDAVMVGQIVITDQACKITTPVGLELELPKSQVLQFDYSFGKLAYLSDLEPTSVLETPILAVTPDGAPLWRYRKNRNLEGGPLRLKGKTYDKGLAVHSRTVLVYDVDGYNVFYCVLGIDDAVAGPAHAVVRIEGDGKTLFMTEVTNRKDKDKPQDVNVPIMGVSQLRITVDYGEDLDLGDHVNLANARVTK